MEEFIANWDHMSPFARAFIIGSILGFVFAARKIIAWIIIIIGLFFGLAFAIDGPIRDTLNDQCDQCGDKFVWYTVEQWFPANDGMTYEDRRQAREDKEEQEHHRE